MEKGEYSSLDRALMDWYSEQVQLNEHERKKRKHHFLRVREARERGDQKKVKELQLERKKYTYRRWYAANRETELVKIRERKAKRKGETVCCSSFQLGGKPIPKEGYTMWVCYCHTCHLTQYGTLGVDPQGRPGIHFRGLWFSFIYPEFGAGVTHTGQVISIK